MIRNLLIAIALALLTGLTFGGSAQAQARWQHYGADHAYASKAAALADAENVFRRAGWSAEVSRAMAQKMRTEPCERVELKNGDKLDFMRTGARGMWRNVLVDFRPYTMNITAKTCKWTLTMGGVTYVAFLPDECNNLAGLVIRAPEVVCDYVLIRAEERDDFLNVGLFGNYAESDVCAPAVHRGPGGGANGLDFDPNNFEPLRPCDRRPCDWRLVTASTGLPLTKHGYVPTEEAGWYLLRLPPQQFSVRSDLLVVPCLTDEDGNRTTFGMGVRHFDYVAMAGGSKVATIWYRQEDMPAMYRQSHLGNLYWRFTEPANVVYGSGSS